MKLNKTGIIGLILTAVGFIVAIFVSTQITRHLTDVSLGYITLLLDSMNALIVVVIIGSVIGALGCLVLGLSLGKSK